MSACLSACLSVCLSHTRTHIHARTQNHTRTRYGNKALHTFLAGIRKAGTSRVQFEAETIELQLEENKDLVEKIVAELSEENGIRIKSAAVTFPIAVNHWLSKVDIKVDIKVYICRSGVLALIVRSFQYE